VHLALSHARGGELQGAHTGSSSVVRGPDRSGERTLCADVRRHCGEKISGGVVVSGSVAEFAVSKRSRSEWVTHGGQKRAFLASHGVCKEQGSGEPVAWSQDRWYSGGS